MHEGETHAWPPSCVQDLENTTGSWDMYGQDDAKRYPSMQNEFFNNAGDILRRREALRGFVALCEWRQRSSSSSGPTPSRASLPTVWSGGGGASEAN